MELLQHDVEFRSGQQAVTDRDALMGVKPAKTGHPAPTDPQPEALAIAKNSRRGKGLCKQRDHPLQGVMGSPAEQVADHLLFKLELPVIVAVLEVAAATDPVIRTGRRNPVGRGLKDGGGDGLHKPFFFEDDPGQNAFTRQDMADKDDPPIFPSGQTVAAIDYFFNPDRQVAHFFNDVGVNEVVFYCNCLAPQPGGPAFNMKETFGSFFGRI